MVPSVEWKSDIILLLLDTNTHHEYRPYYMYKWHEHNATGTIVVVLCITDL